MPLQLTAADLDKLKSKELANAIRKLHAGKTLTNAERALLAQSADAPLLKSGFAPNWNELATALGVSRKALKNWRDDPRYTPQLPVARADGRHDVAAWAAFMVQHNLADSAQHVPLDDDNDAGDQRIMPPKLGGTGADWKARVDKLKGDQIEIGLQKECGTLLVANELEVPLGATFVAMTNTLTVLPERLAPLVRGFDDVPEIIGIIRSEIEIELTRLNAADYIAEVTALVGELPTDPEAARLLSLVSFAGQDHAALLQLIIHCTAAVLRSIGQRAIKSATAPPITHEVTEQPVEEIATETPVTIRQSPVTAPIAKTKTARKKRPRKKA